MHEAAKKGIRLSRQRETILTELRKVKTHPTADEVYDMVRKIMPRISLGTVYRNLDFLSNRGLVLCLGGAGTQKRFDGNPVPHPHLRCSVCGRVEDVDFAMPLPELPPEHCMGYSGLRCDVEFVGVCPECAARMREQREAGEDADSAHWLNEEMRDHLPVQPAQMQRRSS